MSKQEYIHQLKAKLKGLDEKEIEDAITYCEEYFDDAGEGNEEQVIKDLGTPANCGTVKSRIKLFEKKKQVQKRKISAFRNFWIVLIGLCALPLAFPILLVVAIILFTVFIIALSLLFALVVSAFAIITSGFPLLVNAFLHLDAPGNALIAAGGGLFCIGLALLLGSLSYCLVKKLLEWGTKLFHLYMKKQREERDMKKQ